MRAARSLCQGARPRPAFERAARVASRSRPCVHRRCARVIRGRRRSADRAPRGWRAAGLGLSAPIAGLRHAPRVALLCAGAKLFRRDPGRRPPGGCRPEARGPLGLRGIVRHGRPGHRGGHTMHGAVHGRGRRLRHHAALADRAPRLRGARPRAGPALPPPDARARVEALLADAAPGVGWEPFSPERLAELRASGKPVFVNFTAAWCVTCLVNERVALRSPAVAEVFAKKGVVALKADWTTRDPVISRMLGSLGRSGVPLYALYPPGAAIGTPTLLPQILTEGALIDAIDKI